MTMLRSAVRFVARVLRFAGTRLDGLASEPSTGTATAHDRAVWQSAAEHDMAAVPDERFYARQYLHWILPALERLKQSDPPRILDLACGQGRLSVPLAAWCAADGGEVVAVDYAPAAVEGARANARAQGMTNLTVEQADLLAFARALPDASVDAVLMIEAAFVLPEYREALQEIARVLRPGGLAFVAFRSQYFNLLHALRHRLFDSAEMALAQREGDLFGESVWFTWQDRGDVDDLLGQAGLHVLSVRGIGVFSGIEGDPLASIVRPSELSDADQERLLALETSAAESYAACGRYMLAIAQRA
jgi:SAM-dependent methyltransferase